MLYALFIGWWLSKEMTMESLGLDDGLLFKTWRFLIPYIVPVAILVVFISNLAN
jgi:neurotransmitter:Na+ symporter, NSS family